MNKPRLIFLENLVVIGKNPPGKPADEGGNALIKEIRENGVKQKNSWKHNIGSQIQPIPNSAQLTTT
jgi:hypothetical protein